MLQVHWIGQMQHVPDCIHPVWLNFSSNSLLDDHVFNIEIPLVQSPALILCYVEVRNNLTQENTACALVPHKELVATQNTKKCWGDIWKCIFSFLMLLMYHRGRKMTLWCSLIISLFLPHSLSRVCKRCRPKKSTQGVTFTSGFLLVLRGIRVEA